MGFLTNKQLGFYEAVHHLASRIPDWDHPSGCHEVATDLLAPFFIAPPPDDRAPLHSAKLYCVLGSTKSVRNCQDTIRFYPGTVAISPISRISGLKTTASHQAHGKTWKDYPDLQSSNVADGSLTVPRRPASGLGPTRRRLQGSGAPSNARVKLMMGGNQGGNKIWITGMEGLMTSSRNWKGEIGWSKGESWLATIVCKETYYSYNWFFAYPEYPKWLISKLQWILIISNPEISHFGDVVKRNGPRMGSQNL